MTLVPNRPSRGRTSLSAPAKSDGNVSEDKEIVFVVSWLRVYNGSISKLISIAGAECVNAPTET